MTYNMLKLLNCFFLWYSYLNKCSFTWGEMNSNRYEISFLLKISFRYLVSSLLVFRWIEAKWNSNWYGFIWVILTEMKFQTGSRFSCEQNLDFAFNVHMRLKLIVDVISLRSFWQKWNFISGDKPTYHYKH